MKHDDAKFAIKTQLTDSYITLQVLANLQLVSAMKEDSPPPHRGGEIVRGLPCVKKLNQGGVNISLSST